MTVGVPNENDLLSVSLVLLLLLNEKEMGAGAERGGADVEAAGPKLNGTSFLGSTGGGVLGGTPKENGVIAGFGSFSLLTLNEKAPSKLDFGGSTGPALTAPANRDFGISTVGAVGTVG